MDASLSVDREGQMVDDGGKRGGWIIFLFMIGTLMCLTLAAGGWQANLVVYLIEEFNVKNIDATQVGNVVSGCTSLFPFIGAIVADSFFGCFPIILISSCVSFLGLVLFTLTATIASLRPPSCENGSSLCETPSKVQFAVLYASITLRSIGLGGTRFTIATMGANQFDKPKNQGIFFNWFFFAMYTATVVSSTVVVYIEDSVSWGLGFGLSALVNLIASGNGMLSSHPQGRITTTTMMDRQKQLPQHLKEFQIPEQRSLGNIRGLEARRLHCQAMEVVHSPASRRSQNCH
ncbi:hypothetical protein TB2_006281 [Malus domestica]